MKCYACDKRLTENAWQVFTSDGQKQFVGRDCFTKIIKAAANGYKPEIGGPRLFAAKPKELDPQ